MLIFVPCNESIVNPSVLSLNAYSIMYKPGQVRRIIVYYFINTEGSHVIRLGNMNINIIHANKPTRNG